MIKLIVQITKVVIATLLALLATSCGNFNSISGDGNVTTTKRKVEAFTAIKAKNGLEVYLKQGNTTYIEVEADSNLQDHIFTEVENGTLTVYSDANIFKSEAKKVLIEVPNLTNVSASSGVSVESLNELAFKDLKIDASSGSDVQLQVNCQSIICESSSGSQITLSGNTENLSTDSSSGSSIDLSKLIASNVDADASSGSATIVNAKNKLKAEASSGSSIDYVSEPKDISVHESSGGSVSKE